MRDAFEYMGRARAERFEDVQWDDEDEDEGPSDVTGGEKHPLANNNQCGCGACSSWWRPEIPDTRPVCGSWGPGVRCRRLRAHGGQCCSFVGNYFVEWERPG